jgi:hypothetical protein
MTYLYLSKFIKDSYDFFNVQVAEKSFIVLEVVLKAKRID